MSPRYTERSPRPANPILRPAYQGSNPVADIFSLWALEQTVKYLPKVAKDKDNTEARRQLLYVYIFPRRPKSGHLSVTS